MPAIVKSVKEISQGYGSVSNYGSIIGNAVGAATTTMTIPATGATTPAGGTSFNTNGGPPPNRGRGRIRFTSVNGATSISAVTVTVTDGSNVLNVFGAPAALGNGVAADWTFDFNVDIGITSISLTFTTTLGTGATADFEVAMT